MAPVPLNIAPAFRPWRQAGITHLLLDDEVRERLLSQPAPSIPPQEEGRTAPPPRPVQPARPAQPARPLQQARPVQTAQPAQTAQPVQARTQAAPASTAPPAAGREERRQPPPRPMESAPAPYQPPSATTPSVTEPTQPAPETVAKILPPARWPDKWQALLKKTPPRPTLIWTYPSLSRDLGGAADAAHRDFLRRLLGDMGLPKGSHAFWPLNSYPYAEGESEQTVDAPLFLSGIAVLKPESVILMCGQVPPELGLPELHPLLPSIVQGRRFVVTPHVDDLIREPQRYAQLITFLKAITAGR